MNRGKHWRAAAPLLAIAAAAPAAAWVAAGHLDLKLMPTSPWHVLWWLAIAPLVEELVFRQWLQQGLAVRLRAAGATPSPRHGATAFVAAALAAVAFAIAHVPQAGVMAFWWIVPGLALGEVWRRHQQLGLCVAMHAWFNLCLLAVSQINSA